MVTTLNGPKGHLSCPALREILKKQIHNLRQLHIVWCHWFFVIDSILIPIIWIILQTCYHKHLPLFLLLEFLAVSCSLKAFRILIHASAKEPKTMTLLTLLAADVSTLYIYHKTVKKICMLRTEDRQTIGFTFFIGSLMLFCGLNQLDGWHHEKYQIWS